MCRLLTSRGVVLCDIGRQGRKGEDREEKGRTGKKRGGQGRKGEDREKRGGQIRKGEDREEKGRTGKKRGGQRRKGEDREDKRSKTGEQRGERGG